MIILNLLDGVKQTGSSSWQAKCPAHDDRVASLAVRELDDGRILLHCFAGCDVVDVLGTLGLVVTDLFPKPLYHRAKPLRTRFTYAEALKILSHEAGVIAIMASDLAEGKPVHADRAARAAGLIADALLYTVAHD